MVKRNIRDEPKIVNEFQLKQGGDDEFISDCAAGPLHFVLAGLKVYFFFFPTLFPEYH